MYPQPYCKPSTSPSAVVAGYIYTFSWLMIPLKPELIMYTPCQCLPRLLGGSGGLVSKLCLQLGSEPLDPTPFRGSLKSKGCWSKSGFPLVTAESQNYIKRIIAFGDVLWGPPSFGNCQIFWGIPREFLALWRTEVHHGTQISSIKLTCVIIPKRNQQMSHCYPESKY